MLNNSKFVNVKLHRNDRHRNLKLGCTISDWGK